MRSVRAVIGKEKDVGVAQQLRIVKGAHDPTVGPIHVLDHGSAPLVPHEKTGRLAAVGDQDHGSRGGPLDRLPKGIYDLDACNAAVAGEVLGIKPLDTMHQA